MSGASYVTSSRPPPAGSSKPCAQPSTVVRESGVPSSVASSRGRRVGEPQHAALAAGRDARVRLDRSGRDGRPRLRRGRGRSCAGDLAVDAPQRAAVLLAEPAQAGRGVQDAAHLAGRARADQHVADGETAELRRPGRRRSPRPGWRRPCRAACSRRRPRRVRRRRGGRRSRGPGCSETSGRGSAVEDQGAGLVAGAALLGDERGHLDRVAALERVRPHRRSSSRRRRAAGRRRAAKAMSAATGWRQPKLCSATRARAPSAPTAAAARSARP